MPQDSGSEFLWDKIQKTEGERREDAAFDDLFTPALRS